MGCADADTLAALVAGAIDEATRAAIAVHAATCDACHALIAELVDEQTRTSEPARPARELVPGTRVGRYILGERLGAGGMGVVHAATDAELQRRVAVKLLRPDGTGALGTQGRERMMREARVLASLSHPNVVTVFELGAHEGDLFLAMELVDGGSLTAWLRAAPRTQAEILDRLVDAGRGLAAAHAAGVVHRDVKPDNILVGTDGRARVTDFGLARFERAPLVVVDAPDEPRSDDLTQAGARMGTPIYMAPEQVAEGAAGPRADQWSFCATIYEAIAGVRPFPVEERAAAVAQGRLAPPVKGRRVPGWLGAIVQRGLRVDPALRFASMDALVAALVRGRGRRRRIAIGGTAFASVAAMAGVALGLAHRRAALPPIDPAAGGAIAIGSPIALADPRGCGCPLSACTDRCISACSARGYRVGAPLPGVSIAGRQEVLLGMATDGDTLLYLAGKSCTLDHLWLARRRGDTYESIDLTARIDRARVALVEGCCTLAADGRSFAIARADRHGFLRVALAGDRASDITDLGDLAPHATAAVRVLFPVLSADERTLYYMVSDSSLGPTDRGPLDGTYGATRTDLAAPFAPGTRLPGRARFYDFVSGVSADGLSLFMASEYRTHVLVRASTDQPFGDPAEGMLPALLPGWRATPVGDCRRIATTYSPGGCRSEDIVWLEATE